MLKFASLCATASLALFFAVSPAAAQCGQASWYGPGFHGKKTANGERFDQNAMTAAHKTLPLGSTIKVVNNRNGRSITVRVNDRGPFIKGRVLDLSKGAAGKLGFIGRGHTDVCIAKL